MLGLAGVAALAGLTWAVAGAPGAGRRAPTVQTSAGASVAGSGVDDAVEAVGVAVADQPDVAGVLGGAGSAVEAPPLPLPGVKPPKPTRVAAKSGETAKASRPPRGRPRPQQRAARDRRAGEVRTAPSGYKVIGPEG